MPLVSVIMPVYNGEKYVAEAIDSVLTQTFSDFELLIVDDGSQDASLEIIQSFAKLDDRICFMQLARNGGHGPALNAGLAATTGTFITSMDCDDVSLPQRLEMQINFLESHPGIGAVGTCARVMNHDLTTALFDFIVPPQHALIALNLFFGASFVGATVMTRSEFISEVGGYTPKRNVSPDLDLSMRLLRHTPIRFANLPDILFLYRRHDKANTVANAAASHVVEREERARMLQHIWGEAPPSTLDRFQKLRFQHNLSWAERRAAKQDLRRLIDSLIGHDLVDAGDRVPLTAAMNRRLEQASPRIWQQFSHWRRHHFGRRNARRDTIS